MITNSISVAVELGNSSNVRAILTGGGQIYKKAKALTEKYGFLMGVKRKVRELSMGEKQIVALLKALSQDAKILIMDEPSTALPENDI